MENKKLTFMDSLKRYTVTNGICEFELQEVYSMVCNSVYYGVFLNIVDELRQMNYFNTLDRYIFKDINLFDGGTGTTVLSNLDSKDCMKRYFEEKNITYSFKDNAHHIEVKKYPCSVICKGEKVGYRKKWIELTKMYMDCSFSFNNEHRPLSFSYKVDHLEHQEQYINVKDFENLYTVLRQPDFQEDISILVVTSAPKDNIVSTIDAFTSLKFVQRISEDILLGACKYLVAPVKIYEFWCNGMPEEEIFNKIVDAIENDCVALSQISKSSGIAKKTVLMALCYIQNKINKNAPGIQH